MENFDKEEFMEDLNSLPYWVKNEDDLCTFCKHLKFRLIQTLSLNEWYETNCHITENQVVELNKICRNFEEAYNESRKKFVKINEF